jgi:nucleotide-binding universal stress UspA family protein
MYKKILIPTDGSDLARAAESLGIQLAACIGAEVLGLYVAPEYQYPIYVEIIPPSFPTEEEYDASMRKAGATYLDEIRQAAEVARVNYSGIVVFSDTIAEKIVQTAQENHCDLIFIGSHGRSAWSQLLLGSVTNTLLSHSDIPVLVHRAKDLPA